MLVRKWLAFPSFRAPKKQPQRFRVLLIRISRVEKDAKTLGPIREFNPVNSANSINSANSAQLFTLAITPRSERGRGGLARGVMARGPSRANLSTP